MFFPWDIGLNNMGRRNDKPGSAKLNHSLDIFRCPIDLVSEESVWRHLSQSFTSVGQFFRAT